ncbi:gustatory receptor for sugar taste 43a-like [Diabrotica undecimpunctata]|uniref:gustatory receptor for sugar taste 43a-like n=1 Tax=Diabrotica undecimpunctata TaxID=50387 RepID=UPI003B63A509
MEFCIPLIMLSCLLHLIVTPYFLLAKIISDDTDIYYICLQSIWFIGHIGRVLIIVEPCQSCINEHHKTSSVISDMLTYEVDDTIKKGMTMFSLQFNRWKLRFSSCGFFKISRALLTSIAGAVTTYLVILFQFNTT